MKQVLDNSITSKWCQIHIPEKKTNQTLGKSIDWIHAMTKQQLEVWEKES